MKQQKNYTKAIHVVAFVLPMIIALIGLILGGFAPFGSNDIFTASGSQDYLTYYYTFYDHLMNGLPISFSTEQGLGFSLSSGAAYYLSDPLNLLVFLFPKTFIPSIFSFIYVIKVGLAGLFFSFFLSAKKETILAAKDENEKLRVDEIKALTDKVAKKRELAREKAKAKGISEKKDLKLGGSEAPKTKFGTLISLLDFPILAFSTAYALSGFAFSFGLNVAFLSAAVFLPLILLGLNHLVERNSSRLYIIVSAVTIICNLHIGIIVFTFSCLYFLICDFKNTKHLIISLLKKLLSDFLIFGCTFFLIFPIIISSFFSENISSLFPYPALYVSFFDVFKQLLTNIGPSVSSPYGYGINIYSGFFSVFFFVLFIMNKNIHYSNRIRYALLTFILFLGTFIDSLNYLFNGFHYTSYNNVYFSFCFTAIVLILGYTLFLNSEHITPLSINISFISIVTVTILTIIFSYNYASISPFLSSLEILFVVYFLFLLFRNNSMTKLLFSVSLSVLIMAEMIGSYLFAMNTYHSNDYCYKHTDEALFYEAEHHIQDEHPNAKIYIYDHLSNSNPVNLMLSGYDFIITKEGTPNVGALLEKTESFAGVDIYKNPYVLHGFFSEASPSSYEHYDKNSLISYNILSQEYLGGDPIFTTSGNFNLSGSGFAMDKNMFMDKHTSELQIGGSVSQSGHYYRHFIYDQYVGNLIADTETIQDISVPIRDAQGGFSTYSAYLFDSDSFITLFNSLKNKLDNFTINSDHNKYTYSFDSTKSGYFTLDLPYLSLNTNVTVNGQKIVPSLFNGQQICVPVTVGHNIIDITYSSASFLYSLLFTIVFVALLLLISSKKKALSICHNSVLDVIAYFVSSNYVYLTVMLLTSAVFLAGIILTQSAPLGKNMILVGDSYIQDYFYYVYNHDSLKTSGLSLINYSAGFTVFNTQTLISYLFDPFELIIDFLVPSPLYILCNVLPKYLFLIFAGPSIIFYLTHRRTGKRMEKTDFRLIGIGLGYSLSSYAIAYFIYNGFTFLVYVPLILFALERLVYDRKPLLYVLLLGKLMGNAYYAFMLCEFLLLYFFTMDFKSIKDFFIKGIRFGLSSILAALLQGISLLPYYFQIKNSPYQGNDQTAPSLSTTLNPLSTIHNMRMLTTPKTVIWDSSFVNIYSGLLIVLFISLFLFCKDVKLSVRIRKTILATFLFIGFSYIPINYILHGFHYQSGVPNRFAAFFIFLIFTFFYDVLLSIEKMKKWIPALVLSLVSILMIVIWYLKDGFSLTTIASAVFLIIYLAMFFVIYIIRNKPVLFYKSISVFLCIELILSGMNSFYNTIGTRSADNYQSKSSLQHLTSSNPGTKDDFVITEFINNSTNNYSLLTATESISSFSSNLTTSHMNLISEWNLLASSNVIRYNTGNPLADLMLRVKYHVVDIYDDGAASQYNYIGTTDNYELYENPYYLPFGIYFDENPSLMTWDSSLTTDYKSTFDYQNAFSNSLGCRDLYIPIELEEDINNITPSSSYCHADLSVYSEFDSKDEVDLPLNVVIGTELSGAVYLSSKNSLFYLGTAVEGENDEMYFSLPVTKEYSDFMINLAILDTDAYSELHDKLSQNTMHNTTRFFNGFEGDITTPAQGTIFFSLPNVEGWNVYVDEVKVDTSYFLGGIGVPVSSGSHHVKFKYYPPHIYTGAFISLLGLICLLLYFIYYSRRGAHKKNVLEL